MDIPTVLTDVQIKNLVLKPGINVVTLDTNQFSIVYYGLTGTEIDDRIEIPLSFHVKSISIIN